MTASQQVTLEFYYLLNVKIVLLYDSDQMHSEDAAWCKYPNKGLKLKIERICLCVLRYPNISNSAMVKD